MSMDEALQTFHEESREMLTEMESCLLDLEEDPGSQQQLDALFRCVHTIKGSAGLFGLDPVVDFTHVVENVLDRLREGEILLDTNLIAQLLKCRDHIADLLEVAGDEPSRELVDAGAALLSSLDHYQAGNTPLSVADSDEQPRSDDAATAPASDAVENDTWHISIRFDPEVLRNGMDPLGFIRYLDTVGKVRQLITVTDALPSSSTYDPECCYLGFEIDYATEATKADIEAVFEFVRDDCTLIILPPRIALQHYMTLISDLPEEDAKLGEILVASGALTRRELEAGLAAQISEHEAGHPAPPLGQLLVEQQAAEPEVVQAALGKQQQARQAQTKSTQYVKVQADRLDSLINLVGELVIANAGAGLSARRNGDIATQEAVATVANLVEEIRDGSLELRMVAIGETFRRFKRVVRDVSEELGKDINLSIAGADTELDKTVVEQIADPLTHLIRNAVDHGIESAPVRAAADKPLQGSIKLNAYHETGYIVIEVSDDGGGLDRDKILAKAIEREIVRTDQELTDKDIFNLIFEPGFSTADAVSNLSGRGVGMDVVKRNIEALRGAIEVSSTPGQGSMFRIRLPLTLAIIDGFLTTVGDASYVVPLENVVECVELTEAQREESRDRDLINLRGEVLPFIRLRDHFSLRGEPGQRENIVVVKHGDQKIGLIVDVLMGEYQTVIKPLGRLFANLGGISGSTILGSGEVALILDVPHLVKQGSRQSGVARPEGAMLTD